MGPADAAGEEASVSGSGLRPLAGRVRRRDGAPGQGGKRECPLWRRCRLELGDEKRRLNVVFLILIWFYLGIFFSTSSSKNWNCGFGVFQEEEKINKISVESRVRKDRESR